MPAVTMLLEQPIRLLERKEIQHQVADPIARGRVGNLVVQDARVARREHRIRAVRAFG